MPSKLFKLVMVFIILSKNVLAENGDWSAVGEYGKIYPCGAEARANGYPEGSKRLIITTGEGANYRVEISNVSCPTGHLCDVHGIGQKEGDILKVTGILDEGYEDLSCEFKIRILKGDGLDVSQTSESGNCERKFLCGARSGPIDGEYPKMLRK